MLKNTTDKLAKVLMGAAMAFAGAAVVAGLQAIQGLDFGTYTPVVVAVSSILINAARVAFLVPHAEGKDGN